MKLELVRQLWGGDEPSAASFIQFSEFGYSALETGVPAAEDLQRFKQLVKERNFGVIAMVFTAGSSVADHLRSLEIEVERAQQLAPRFVNAHSGRDSWSPAEAKHYFAEALEIERRSGLTIAHETHRGRVLFNPWITRDLLLSFPELKLTCDYSHWVCVAERLLDAETDILELCAQRAHHIHARVGHEQGPQVADPRAPEYQRHLLAHERYWDMIWASQETRGVSVSTLTPEFGPPPYMPTLPFSNVPVTDLKTICDWQANRQRARFSERTQR